MKYFLSATCCLGLALQGYSCASVTAPLQIKRSIDLQNIYQNHDFYSTNDLKESKKNKQQNLTNTEKGALKDTPLKEETGLFYETSQYYFFVDHQDFIKAKEYIKSSQLEKAHEVLIKILAEQRASQNSTIKMENSDDIVNSSKLQIAKTLNNLAIVDFLEGRCLPAKEKINEALEPLSRFPEVFANNRLLSSCLKDFTRLIKNSPNSLNSHIAQDPNTQANSDTDADANSNR